MAYTFPSLYPQSQDNSNDTLRKILIVQLGILAATASSSGGAILSGSGNPNGSVTSTASPQLYYDTAGPGLYINSGAIGTNSWTQLI